MPEFSAVWNHTEQILVYGSLVLPLLVIAGIMIAGSLPRRRGSRFP